MSLIKDLYEMPAGLLGAGYDNRLEYLKQLIKLDVLEFPSGTQFETWTVPQEWIVNDAWVKFNGKKIFDFKKEPMSLMWGSEPFEGIIDKEEFMKHLFVSEEMKDAIPYEFNFYGNKWGFCAKYNDIYKLEDKCADGTCVPELKNIDPDVGKAVIDLGDKQIGLGKKSKVVCNLEDGEYDVLIDAKRVDGTMKIGVHTIPGKTDKEILLFAHLDHPYTANDNLSGVDCLVGLAKQIKKAKIEHTVKIIFCPETIGSIAYAHTQDLSNVDFMIAVDICGNDNSLLLQKSFDESDPINAYLHLAATELGRDHRKAQFRLLIGSDEYVFNDPKIGIPGIMVSRYPYKEYHTSADTPDICKRKFIKETQEYIMKFIDIYEKDYIPVRNFTGPLMRSKFEAQTGNSLFNRQMDYLIYMIDGKKSLAEIVCQTGLNFDFVYKLFTKLQDENLISHAREIGFKTTSE